MAATLLLDEREPLEVPADVQSLADFRHWALSDGFPERGRIDFIAGRIEVDMSPEDLFCHSAVKSEIGSTLHQLTKRDRLGHLFIDRARVSCPDAALSCEPDVVFVSRERIDSGRVHLVPKTSGLPGRYVEIEGPPDLVVEVVSDSSVEKDTRRLPPAYFRAGVRELWLADARGERPTLVIHHRRPAAFVPADRDADGFQQSHVFGRRFRLDAAWEPEGHWSFDLRYPPSAEREIP